MVGKRMCRLIQTCWILSCTVTETILTSQVKSWIKNGRMPEVFGERMMFFELHWHLCQAVLCTGRNKCSCLKQTLSKIVVFVILSIPILLGSKFVFFLFVLATTILSGQVSVGMLDFCELDQKRKIWWNFWLWGLVPGTLILLLQMH